MEAAGVQVFYDGEGKPVAVQMPIAEYEKIVQRAKEAVATKEAITKAVEALKSAL